ncbi:MAG: ABC transporter permease [Verrucomicrobia bacterium]|nr:ABC transporter permease [Cytophagales bacterium]
MLQNYLTIAFRNLRRNKVYSFINIFGLAIGLTAGILMILWVQDELGFDKFHKDPEKLFVLAANINLDGKEETWRTTAAPLAVFGKREIPEIVNACRIADGESEYLYQYKDKSFMQGKVAFVEDSFFAMFNFPLIKGNQKKPFSSPMSMVLTETASKKYFGNEDPVGKTIKIDNKYTIEVSGIIKDMPDNTSLPYEVLISFEVVKKEFGGNGEWKTVDEDWGNYSYYSFFQLKDESAATAVAKKLTLIHKKNQPNEFTSKLKYLMQPMQQIHLYNPDGSEAGILIVRIMALVAGIIILIACINYVNLATARATKRAKEVSMRKIVGANKSQLFGQFLGESVIVFVIALVLALVLIVLLIPIYNDIMGKKLVFNPFNPQVLWVLGVTMLATLLLAGAYPAFLLASFKPLEAMKGTVQSSGGKNAVFRKGLVVIQFSFSIILIISTLVIGKQLDFIRNKNLGYNKENILTFGMREINQHYDVAKTELLKQTGVSGVTASGQNILDVGSKTGDTDWDGKDPKRAFLVNQMPVERNFLKVLGLQLAQGSGFTDTPADSTNYILNETAVAQMGIKDPVGKRFKFHERNGTIVGVVKDFHFRNLRQQIEPMILFYYPNWRWKMYVKTTAKDAPKVIATAEKIWKQYNTDYPFEYNFLDDDFNKMYQNDQTVGKLFNFFAGIAIFISCLGLFGLATYTAETKTKEIGIRKVLGASVGNIVGMLSKDFIKLVALAALIAFPLAWYGLNKLLESYAYRITIQWWIFALAGVLALMIALFTISFQAIRAALANPVKSLRTE